MPASQNPRLTRHFYRQDPTTLARALLGQTLVRILPDGSRLAGTIVETEAYLGVPDLAAHTAGGRRTPRNESMYHDGGHAYVYFTYGLHHCFNVVAQHENQPTACLIRALEPLQNIETMRNHRLANRKSPTTLKLTDLTSGPAKLCQALAIDRTLDRIDLTTSTSLWIEKAPSVDIHSITAAPRIGVQYAKQWATKPLRFFIQNNPHVSA